MGFEREAFYGEPLFLSGKQHLSHAAFLRTQNGQQWEVHPLFYKLLNKLS